MLRTFNCGIGGILVVNKEHANDILKLLKHDNASIIGEIIKSTGITLFPLTISTI